MLLDGPARNTFDICGEYGIRRALVEELLDNASPNPGRSVTDGDKIGDGASRNRDAVGCAGLFDGHQELADVISQLSLWDLFGLHATSVAEVLHTYQSRPRSPLLPRCARLMAS